MDENLELYRKHRPKKLSEVVGQPEAVAVLSEFSKNGTWPHAILLAGPSGTGKTTIARIIKRRLGCDGRDYTEINAASARGIDTVREIEQRIGMAPFNGQARIWYFDEAHRQTTDSQSSLLKLLEDPPAHAYFILATTEPQKLLDTIRTRCTKIMLRALTPGEISTLVMSVAAKEELKISQDLADRIAEVVNGSARDALVILNQVAALATEQDRLNAVVRLDVKADAFEIVRKLLWKDTKWPELAELLRRVADNTTDYEGIRRLVLANAKNELLKCGKAAPTAGLIIEFFKDPWYTEGDSRMVWCCWEVLRLKGKV